MGGDEAGRASRKAQLTPEQAADLFAYFVSARYFEKPGDAARGKQAFAAKHCADCHGITEFAGRRRAAGGQVGIAGRPDGAGAADVEPRRRRCATQFAKKKLAWRTITGRN